VKRFTPRCSRAQRGAAAVSRYVPRHLPIHQRGQAVNVVPAASFRRVKSNAELRHSEYAHLALLAPRLARTTLCSTALRYAPRASPPLPRSIGPSIARTITEQPHHSDLHLVRRPRGRLLRQAPPPGAKLVTFVAHDTPSPSPLSTE